MAKFKDPRAIEPLTLMLKDGHPSVRKSAAQSLGNVEDPRALASLMASLADSVNGNRYAIVRALKQITGQKYGTTAKGIRQWLEWWQENQHQYPSFH